MIKTYEEALAFIHGRAKFKKEPTLKRMRLFLERLGNPQQGQHYIHITGTNGKGSVAAMLRTILLNCGLTVGSFTSPFITRFNERIEYNGHQISDENLVRLTQKVAPVALELDEELPAGGPTEFEVDTAIMFCYLQEKQPDVILLEVGIGGLYDSTNVIIPEVSVITTVGWDHMKYLGNTLGAIASQKAGIIKPGAPVVIGKLPLEAQQVIAQKVTECGDHLYQLGSEFTATKVNGKGVEPILDYRGLTIHHGRYQLNLAGDYQVENAAVAVTAAQLFLQRSGLPVDLAAIKEGLATAKWPGRMEKVSTEPLVFLDGAHNLPGMQALVKTIRDDFNDRDVYVLVAILADKQYDLMLGELASLGNVHLMVTNFAGPGPKRPSADLSQAVGEIKTRYPVQVAGDWQAGLVDLAHQLSADDVLIVTGSLYFISDVRHLFADN